MNPGYKMCRTSKTRMASAETLLGHLAQYDSILLYPNLGIQFFLTTHSTRISICTPSARGPVAIFPTSHLLHHHLFYDFYVPLLNTLCFSSPAYTLALTPTSSNSSIASNTASSSSTSSAHLSPPSFAHRKRSRSRSPRGYQVTLDLGMLETGSGEGDEERPGSSGGQSIRETLDKMAGFRRALRFV
jgi:hypothetical protein